MEPFQPIVPASTTKMDPKLAYRKPVLPLPKLHFVKPSKPGAGFYDSPQVQSIEGSPFFGGFFPIHSNSEAKSPIQASSYKLLPRNYALQEEFGQEQPQEAVAQARSSENEASAYEYEDLVLDEDSRPVFKIYDAVPVQEW